MITIGIGPYNMSLKFVYEITYLLWLYEVPGSFTSENGMYTTIIHPNLYSPEVDSKNCPI